MQELDATPGAASRYTATTVDHFQHPRNVGRLAEPSGMGRVDDPDAETTVTIYVKVAGGQVAQATFRALGCSACVAASSMATELLTGARLDVARMLDGDRLDTSLGGLPADKRYCADLAALAVRRALDAATAP